MKVLLISNMYPALDKPYSGIFVQNQFKCLEKSINVSIHYLESKNTNSIRSILKYLTFFLNFTPYLFKKYDVIHVHFFGYHTFLAIIYRIFHPKIKLVVTFHGSDSNNISKPFFKWMIKKINNVLAVGAEQSKYLLGNTDIEHIEIKPAGIDKEIFYPITCEKEFDFIFVGNFFKQKGIDIIIESIKDLKNNKFTFCFVGNGPFEAELRKLIGFKVSVYKNQNQNELRVLLNKSKFLLLPSRGDSFGLVVTESMYCGTPVIISNIGGMKDQVIDNYNGFIMKENNAENLVEAMQSSLDLSSEKYTIMSLNASKSNPKFSLDYICDDLIQYYYSIN